MKYPRVLETLFGIWQPVSRRTYAAVGLSLAVVKYGVDATVVHWSTGQFFSPALYLLPMLSMRGPLMAMPGWVLAALLLWTLPFLWIGLVMTLRRTIDADQSPWLALVYFIPVANYLLMILLCFMPSRPRPPRATIEPPSGEDDLVRTAALGVLSALAIACAMIGVAVYVFRGYGAGLFFGTPVVLARAISRLPGSSR